MTNIRHLTEALDIVTSQLAREYSYKGFLTLDAGSIAYDQVWLKSLVNHTSSYVSDLRSQEFYPRVERMAEEHLESIVTWLTGYKLETTPLDVLDDLVKECIDRMSDSLGLIEEAQWEIHADYIEDVDYEPEIIDCYEDRRG